MRIGIVNDLKAACEALRRVVDSLPDHEVVWTASDGVEAIAMAKRDRPDLILMDLLMPHMDGAQATRQIMTAAPCAILVVTATVSGNISLVYDAMGYGALASYTREMLPLTVAVTTKIAHGAVAMIWRVACEPSMCGISRSIRIRSGRSRFAIAIASTPSLAVQTTSWSGRLSTTRRRASHAAFRSLTIPIRMGRSYAVASPIRSMIVSTKVSSWKLLFVR